MFCWNSSKEVFQFRVHLQDEITAWVTWTPRQLMSHKCPSCSPWAQILRSPGMHDAVCCTLQFLAPFFTSGPTTGQTKDHCSGTFSCASPCLRIPGYCSTTKLQLMPNSNVSSVSRCAVTNGLVPQITYLYSHTKCLKEEQSKYRRLNSPRDIKSDTGGNVSVQYAS